MIYQIFVDPDFNFVAQTLNHHCVPLPQRFFGFLCQVLNAASFAFRDAPFLFWSTSFNHVGDGDVFDDAPEITGMLVIHLDFD